MSIIIDIGNTHSKIVKIVSGELVQSASFSSRSIPDWALNEYTGRAIIIVSVVPAKTKEAEKAVKKLTGTDPYIVCHDHFKSIKSKYLNICELGLDRLCNIAYAVKYHKRNTVVIDLGSAVTFEIINGRSEFEGGMILPGIKLQYEALAKNTALLPELKSGSVNYFIGRSTAECIRSGVQHGIAAVCNDFVREFKERISSRMTVVLSGGDADLVGTLVDFDHIIEKHTVPLGALEIHKMYLKNETS